MSRIRSAALPTAIGEREPSFAYPGLEGTGEAVKRDPARLECVGRHKARVVAEQLIERSVLAQDDRDFLLSVPHRHRPERYLPREVHDVTPSEMDGHEVLERVDQRRLVEDRSVVDGGDTSGARFSVARQRFSHCFEAALMKSILYPMAAGALSLGWA